MSLDRKRIRDTKLAIILAHPQISARDKYIVERWATTNQSQAKIGAELGISPSRIGQLILRASYRATKVIAASKSLGLQDATRSDQPFPESLGLSARSANAIRVNNIKTIEELRSILSNPDTARLFSWTQNLGAKSMMEICEVLGVPNLSRGETLTEKVNRLTAENEALLEEIARLKGGDA
jgi:DNA-binding CsgD family transcriptional regulator